MNKYLSTFKGQAIFWLCISIAPLIALAEKGDNSTEVPDYALRIGNETLPTYLVLFVGLPLTLLCTRFIASPLIRASAAVLLLISSAVSCSTHLRGLLKEFLFPIGPSESSDHWVRVIARVRPDSKPPTASKQSHKSVRENRKQAFAHSLINEVIGNFSSEFYIRLSMLYVGIRFFFACALAIVGFSAMMYIIFLIEPKYFDPTTQAMSSPSLVPFLIAGLGYFTTQGSGVVVPRSSFVHILVGAETLLSLVLLTVFFPLVLMIFDRNLKYWSNAKAEAKAKLRGEFPDLFSRKDV